MFLGRSKRGLWRNIVREISSPFGHQGRFSIFPLKSVCEVTSSTKRCVKCVLKPLVALLPEKLRQVFFVCSNLTEKTVLVRDFHFSLPLAT